MPNDIISALAKCPYFTTCAPSSITCEWLRGATLTTKFKDKERRTRHAEKYCCTDKYEKCPISAIMELYYEKKTGKRKEREGMAIYPKMPHGSIKENPLGWLQYLRAIQTAIRTGFDADHEYMEAARSTALDVCRIIGRLLLFAAIETLHRSFENGIIIYRLQPEDPRKGDIWLEGTAEQYNGKGWDEISNNDVRLALSIASESRDKTRIFFPEELCAFPASDGDICLKDKSLCIFSKEQNTWSTIDCSNRLYETRSWIVNIQTENGEGKGAFTESSLKFYKCWKFVGGIAGERYFLPDGRAVSVERGVQ